MASSLPRLVGLEEHWLSPKFQSSDLYGQLYGPHLSRAPALSDQFRDVSNGRISDMIKNDISFQVISHAPGLRSLESAKPQMMSYTKRF